MENFKKISQELDIFFKNISDQLEKFGDDKLNSLKELTLHIEEEINKIYGEFTKVKFEPLSDVYNTKENIEITYELPGCTNSNIEISFKNNCIYIVGEKCKDNFYIYNDDIKYQKQERIYGKFEKIIPISKNTDVHKIKAKFYNGVLRITIPNPIIVDDQTTIHLENEYEYGNENEYVDNY
jgi:HSP20 family protein